MDKRKYIIELPDDEHLISWWTYTGTEDGKQHIDFHEVVKTPYDLDAIRKEAYQQGYKDGYNKHDTERIRKREYDKGLDDIGNALRLLLFQYSNYTLQEIFGYDTARAVVEYFEGSEIVARIRCYDGGVKQDAETIRKEAYDKGYKDATVKIGSNEQAIAEEAYQRGLNDAWEAARKIILSREDGGLFSYEERKAVFGCGNYMTLKKFLAPEAIEKIRQYEQEKEQQIQVGDEVVFYNGEKCVVTVVGDGQVAEVMDKGGFSMRMDDGLRNSMKKTGRHFPEIAKVLKKMQEETTFK